MPKRSILVAVDIENQTASNKKRVQSICRVASALAGRLKLGAELLYVEDPKSVPRGLRDPARVRSWHVRHQELLRLLSRQFPGPVYRPIKRGSPADQILKASAASELVVMGTQGRKGLSRLFVGSVAEEVIRHSRRPVMVVGPVAQERDRDLAARKDVAILAATDLGKNSRAAERYALSLAKRIGARVVLFHCLWDTINAVLINTAYSGMAAFRLDEIIHETRNGAVGVLKRKAGFFRAHGVSCEYKLQEKAVLSSCGVYLEGEAGYSFIIMGTRARNILLGSFFGSTARETILNASIPVVTVHS